MLLTEQDIRSRTASALRDEHFMPPITEVTQVRFRRCCGKLPEGRRAHARFIQVLSSQMKTIKTHEISTTFGLISNDGHA
jgi:hypothetical protein